MTPPLSDATSRVAFRRALLRWYRTRARDLPWRQTRDPYAIWLSEIMLQQTRVETAIPYYERFLAAFPTVSALADAPLERVLKLWEGLGYYTRARNLHRAAGIIARERDGQLPTTIDEWVRLPGVGRYTAGAIASITTGAAAPAVDGNVKRVIARLMLITRSIDHTTTQATLWTHAEQLLARRSAGDFNQAMMELGARCCTARRPECETCPVTRWCAARASGRESDLPIRGKKRVAPRVDAAAAVVSHRGRILLMQRPATGLLAGLWGWPAIEVRADADDHAARLRDDLAKSGLRVRIGAHLTTVRHQFTHRDLRLHVYAGRVESGRLRSPPGARLKWVGSDELAELPLATVDRKVLAQLDSVMPG